MQLFELREPSNSVEAPGIPVRLDPAPHVHFGNVPGVGPFNIPLFGVLAENAQHALKQDPAHLLFAGELHAKEGEVFLRSEPNWNKYANKNRGALVHLNTEVGENGKLILTGPRGRAELVQEDGQRPWVVAPWLPFSEAVGVSLLTDDVCEVTATGEVRWKEEHRKEAGTPFLLLTMLKGASFRVIRTGDLQGAAREFVVTWTGFELITKVFTRGPRNR